MFNPRRLWQKLFRALERTPSPAPRKRSRYRFRPQVEILEDRLAPATIAMVNTPNDTHWDSALYPSNPYDASGNTSLRSAIEYANQNDSLATSASTIDFSASANGTIKLTGAPAAPTTGSTLGGTFSATTYYVEVTYVYGTGEETLVSAEATQFVAAGNYLTVTSPPSITGPAGTVPTGWNVYVGKSSGAETLQNLSGSIALGTNWTETAFGTNALPPTAGFAPLQVDDTNSHGLTIDGSGFSMLVSGQSATEVFKVGKTGSSPTVTINDLTIENGFSTSTSGNPGGILNSAGNLTVSNSTFTGNTGEFGGAIFTLANLTITNSTIANNTATGGGGGVYASAGNLTITNSTIDGNKATTTPNGGGIYNAITNGNLKLFDSIVDGNTATTGADIDNTITTPTNTFISEGYNLYGNGTKTVGVTWMSGKDIADTNNSTSLMGALQYNGGPTPTQALTAGNLALGAGSATAPAGITLPTTDQRGYQRVVANQIDIGAWQNQSYTNNFPSSSDFTSHWTVVADNSGTGAFTVGTNNVVGQTGKDNIATVNNITSWSDVSASANVTLPSSGATTFGGVMVRRDSSNDAYVALLFHAGTTNYAILALEEAGVLRLLTPETGLGQANPYVSGNSWAGASHNVRLDASGTTLKMYLDGNLLITATDSTLSASGGEGIYDINGGTTFANFLAYELLPAPAPFTVVSSTVTLNFNQPSTSTNTLGDPWSVDEGGFTVNSSNQAVAASTTNVDVASLYGFAPASATISATFVGLGGGVVADWNGLTQSGYVLLLTSSAQLTLYKASDGLLTQITFWTLSAGVANTGTTPNTLKLVFGSGTLTPTLNGNALSQFSDSTFSSGSVGIASNVAGTYFTSFSTS